MTRRQKELTITFTLGVILGILILSFTAFSCEAAEAGGDPLNPKPGDFIEAPSNPNSMVYYSTAPLTTVRFVSYGKLKNQKGIVLPS